MSNSICEMQLKCLICNVNTNTNSSFSLFCTIIAHSKSLLASSVQKVIKKNIDNAPLSRTYLCSKCFSYFEELDITEQKCVRLKENILKRFLQTSQETGLFIEDVEGVGCQTDEQLLLCGQNESTKSKRPVDLDLEYSVNDQENLHTEVTHSEETNNDLQAPPPVRRRGRKPKALKQILDSTNSTSAPVVSSVKKKESRKRRRYIHPCDLCGHMFRRPCELKQHLLTHGGAKPFRCRECGKRFASKSNAGIHVLKQHGKDINVENVIEICNDAHDDDKDITQETSETTVLNSDILDDVNGKNDHSSESGDDFEWKMDENSFDFDITNESRHSPSDEEEKNDSLEIDSRYGEEENSYQELETNKGTDTDSIDIKHELENNESEYKNKKETLRLKLKRERKSSADNGETKQSKRRERKKRDKTVLTPKPPKHKCELCGKMWRTMSEYKSHIATHSDERPFICEICGQAYKHKAALDVHVGMHNGINPFSCPYCNKAFTQKGALQRHLPIHTGEAPYQCELCGKRFVHHTSFNMHTLAHTGKKSYKCNICGLALLSGSHLKRHSRVHTGERPYQCQRCNKSFAERYNLVAHARVHDAPGTSSTKESSKKVHRCQLCGANFDRKAKLDDHLTVTHNKINDPEESRKWYNQILNNELENQQVLTNTPDINHLQLPMPTSNVQMNVQIDHTRRHYNDQILLPHNIRVSEQDLKNMLTNNAQLQQHHHQNILGMRPDGMQQQQSWHPMVFGGKTLDTDLIDNTILESQGLKQVPVPSNLDNQHRLLSEMSTLGNLGGGHTRNMLSTTLMGGHHHNVVNPSQSLHIPNSSHTQALLHSRMFSPDVN